MNGCLQCVASRGLKARLNGSFRAACTPPWLFNIVFSRSFWFLLFLLIFLVSLSRFLKIEMFCSCFLLKFPFLLFCCSVLVDFFCSTSQNIDSKSAGFLVWANRVSVFMVKIYWPAFYRTHCLFVPFLSIIITSCKSFRLSEVCNCY